jgi:hypothetical protein
MGSLPVPLQQSARNSNNTGGAITCGRPVVAIETMGAKKTHNVAGSDSKQCHHAITTTTTGIITTAVITTAIIVFIIINNTIINIAPPITTTTSAITKRHFPM